MFNLLEIKKKSEGLDFDVSLDLKADLLARQPELLDVKNVRAKGRVSYDKGLYLLNYDLSYSLVLPSSRSMESVELSEEFVVTELFIESSQVADKKEMVDEDLVLIIEGDTLDLSESVADNILLNIPLQVLTDEERESDVMPSGQSWSVLTENQYQDLKEEKKETNNPFAVLDNLFDD